MFLVVVSFRSTLLLVYPLFSPPQFVVMFSSPPSALAMWSRSNVRQMELDTLVEVDLLCPFTEANDWVMGGTMMASALLSNEETTKRAKCSYVAYWLRANEVASGALAAGNLLCPSSFLALCLHGFHLPHVVL